MQKIINNGNRNTGRFTVNGECEVIFSSPYRCFEAVNEGTGDIILSLESGRTAADEGVIVIPPNSSATLAHMRNDINTVYVSGNGDVQIAAKNETEAVFKSASGGGDGSGGIEFLGNFSFEFDANERVLTQKPMFENREKYTMLIFTIGSYSVTPQINNFSERGFTVKFNDVDSVNFGDVSIIVYSDGISYNIGRTVYTSAATLNVQVWGIK